MQRTPVSSSNLVSVGYDPAANTLEVEFKQGSVYSYAGVPSNVHRDLMNAPSHGSYFSRHIRDNYPTTRIK